MCYSRGRAVGGTVLLDQCGENLPVLIRKIKSQSSIVCVFESGRDEKSFFCKEQVRINALVQCYKDVYVEFLMMMMIQKALSGSDSRAGFKENHRLI